MLESLALLVVFLAGAYLVALAMLCLVAPGRATRFLGGFAGSAATHYLELAIRLAVGAAFLVIAPRSLFPGVFTVVGWVLVATTAVLTLVPWRWHRRFAERSVPRATRHLRPLAAAALAMGAFVLVSAGAPWLG